MPEKEKPKEEKKPKNRYVVGEIVTQTSPAIIDTTKSEDDEERVVKVYPPELVGMVKGDCKIMNDLNDLKKLLD